MKPNYPVADGKGGISQQRLELLSRMQRDGIKRFLRAADLRLEGLTVVDLGCRNGDTTLGLAEMTNNETSIVAVEEIRAALLIAKAKFGEASNSDLKELYQLLGIKQDNDPLWLKVSEIISDPGVYAAAAPFFSKADSPSRIHFRSGAIENLPDIVKDADLIVGFQTLHWLNADKSELPTKEIMKAIYDSLASGGIFIAGTSTAFVEHDMNALVEGKTRAEYSVDEHPFFKEVYLIIEEIVAKITKKFPEPVSNRPPFNLSALKSMFEHAGFIDFRNGAFLATFGRELAITEQIKLRPIHQGMLNGVEDPELRRQIIDYAIATVNGGYDIFAKAKVEKPDPRLDDQHIYDAVPFVMARKA